MMTRTTRAGLMLALVTAVGTETSTQPGTQAPIEGVWRLKAYQGGGNEGPASGLLIFDRGYFSFVYMMNENRPQSDGRAHAGRYRLDRGSLTFTVDWNLHYVGGKGITDRNSTESTTRVVLKGSTMTITFDNGAVQTLERAAEAMP
jgi:hypothetical protein